MILTSHDKQVLVFDEKFINNKDRSVCSAQWHYTDVIMTEGASQITSLTIVYSAVNLVGDQRKHQSSVSLAFVRGIHRRPVNSPRKWPVTRKMFPFDDVIMTWVPMAWQCKAPCHKHQWHCPRCPDLEYSGFNTSWFLVSPGHQQPRYWL